MDLTVTPTHATLAAIAALAAAGARRRGSRSEPVLGREEWVLQIMDWGGPFRPERKRRNTLDGVHHLYGQLERHVPSLLTGRSIDALLAEDESSEREAQFYVELAKLADDQQLHFARIHLRQPVWFLPVYGPMHLLTFLTLARKQGEKLPAMPTRKSLHRTVRKLYNKIAKQECATQPVREQIPVHWPWVQIRTEAQAKEVGRKMKNCEWWFLWCAREPDDRYQDFYHPGLDILVQWDPDYGGSHGITTIQIGVDQTLLYNPNSWGDLDLEGTSVSESAAIQNLVNTLPAEHESPR